MTIQACPNGQNACSAAAVLSWQRFDYDGLGRAHEERLRLPTTAGVVDHVRTTEYNALGWKTSESAWGNATKVTTFDQYDPFGRVGRITPPGQPPVSFTYQGEGVKTRKVKIMMASGQQEFAYTTERYDSFGRLRKMCEDMAATWSDLEQQFPGCAENILSSMGRIKPHRLMDHTLFDFVKMKSAVPGAHDVSLFGDEAV